jgi:hypothetical protein
MLAVDDLDDATVERAGALVASEQAAARQVRPELPAASEVPRTPGPARRRCSGCVTAAITAWS